MITKFKRIISIITILLMMVVPGRVWALDAPTAPTPPPEPTTETVQSPTPPPEPTTPTLEETTTPTPTPKPEESTNNQTSDDPSPSTTQSPEENSTTDNSSLTGPQASGNVGDTTLNTGDALTDGNISTFANTNLAETSPSETSEGTNVTNSGNGMDSDNSASVSSDSSLNTIQENSATVTNNLELQSDSGSSTASENVGDTIISTGDSDTSGTVVTDLNSNLAGVAVSEFNVVDDQNGDLLLDFAGNCISGCDIFSNALVENSGNGSDSTNSTDLTQDTASTTFQNNDATLENNLLLGSNSGDNTALKNVGDTTIQTGDANTSANVMSFLNNNLSGDVLIGVVNIFGDLIGDIILPDIYGTSSLTASNTGNGSDSTNSASLDQTLTDTTYQTNDAQIVNNLNLQATTGDNLASKNTGGDSTITTGDANITAQVLNVVNSNIDSGYWWLVLVNEAGEWTGKILGAPDGSNMAGSEGTEFTVNANGDITAQNIGNGTDSQNSATIDQSSSNTTIQNNVAKILNNINLFANSGGNSASSNTGGNSTINTGDANVVANLVNFINNNIVGSGKLTVVTINVFGKWIGDFVGPGQKKMSQETAANPQGSSIDSTAAMASQTSATNTTAENTDIQATLPILALNTVFQSTNQPFEPVQTQVAGVKIFADQSTNNSQNATLGKKKVAVNLAWGLLLLPLLLTGYIFKKKWSEYHA
ncbi:MAG: hypothetical protein Q7S44_01250 [bacterium]|nr:hypothetical protein [bacterium]